MNIYDFLDYKEFVASEVKKRPKKGHGQYSKIAKALNIHTTMVTHIFKGQLHLSSEQCLALADFLGLNPLETEYFENLVLYARAGDQRTKIYYQKKIETIQEKALSLSKRLGFKNSLDLHDQAFYYSNWIYVAICLMTAIPKFQTRVALAMELGLPPAKINRVLDFLISSGLCKEEGGKIIYGNINTYVDAESPLVVRHHSNWRLKAIEHFENLDASELAYTHPVVISEKDFLKIRGEIMEWINKFNKISGPSACERLCCLNIDWFRVTK